MCAYAAPLKGASTAPHAPSAADRVRQSARALGFKRMIASPNLTLRLFVPHNALLLFCGARPPYPALNCRAAAGRTLRIPLSLPLTGFSASSDHSPLAGSTENLLPEGDS